MGLIPPNIIPPRNVLPVISIGSSQLVAWIDKDSGTSYPADVMATALRAGMASFEEARVSLENALGWHTKPAYESMLLTAGYAAEMRCEEDKV